MNGSRINSGKSINGQYCEILQSMNGSRINSGKSPCSLHCTRAKHWPYRRLAWEPYFAGGHYIVGNIFSAIRVRAESLQVSASLSSPCEFAESLRGCRVEQRVFHEYPAWRLTRPDSRVLASLGRVVLHWFIYIYDLTCI